MYFWHKYVLTYLFESWKDWLNFKYHSKSWWWLNICQGSHVGNITRWKSIFAARKPLTWSWFIIAQGLHIQHNGAPSPCEVAFFNFPTLKTIWWCIICNFSVWKIKKCVKPKPFAILAVSNIIVLLRRLFNETPKSLAVRVPNGKF